MSDKAKMFALILLLSAMAFAVTVAPISAIDTDYQDYNSGSGGGCSYCSQAQCGCAPPPLGKILYFSCTCSPIQCTRSCNYN